MQSLLGIYQSTKKFLAKEIPYVICVPIFLIILASLITFLALPTKASIKSATIDQKLDGEIILDFSFPVQRDDVNIEILPPIDFEYDWEGILVNQKLSIKPKTLLTPDESYQINVTNIRNPLGTSDSNQTFLVQTESLPKVVASYPKIDSGRIKPKPTFSFTLDKNVSWVNYELISLPYFETQKKQTGNTLEFFTNTTLKQGEEYVIGLKLTAKGLPSTNLFEGNFLVVKPLKITETAPKQKITNASKKSVIEIKFNKNIKPVFLGSFIKIKPFQEAQYEFKDKKTIKITPKLSLKTATDYKIIVDQKLEASDGAVLEDNYTLKFKTAGPVTVVATTPNGWGVPLASIISVTFDQKVDKKSAESKFAISPNVAGAFSWDKNTMYFIPSSTLSLFKNHSFSLAKGIKGPGGDPSNNLFSYNFTTTSERVVSIGKSVQGRSINAYYFGTGSKKILLVGSMHGTEANTSDLLLGWVAYLRANQSLLPKDRTFIVVPNSNPDGVVKEDRFNTRGVDLNRNWDTPTWTKDTFWTYGKVKGGGGSDPFSEPETRALRDLINRENPKITISYHSTAGVIISDGAASNKLRDWYSRKTGYTAVAGAPVNFEDEFSYDVTGSLEEWLGEKNKIILVVELATSYSSEFLRNLPALKGLFTYPL